MFLDLTVMELSRTISLWSNACRFLTIVFAAAMASSPALPLQTAKELIPEACYNELQHRDRKTLWSYTAERRVNSHSFLEQVIETVDGPVRHLLEMDDHPLTQAQMKEELGRQQELLNNPSGRHADQKQRDDDDVLRNLQPLQYEPARSAQQLVMWNADRMWTLWFLLLTNDSCMRRSLFYAELFSATQFMSRCVCE
jgi:hypothetical protein